MKTTAATLGTDPESVLRFRLDFAKRERDFYQKKCEQLREEQDAIDRKIVYADGNLERCEGALERAQKELDVYLASEGNAAGAA